MSFAPKEVSLDKTCPQLEYCLQVNTVASLAALEINHIQELASITQVPLWNSGEKKGRANKGTSESNLGNE